MAEDVKHEYGLILCQQPKAGFYDAIILAAGHNEFKAFGADKIHTLRKGSHVLYDLKYILDKNEVDLRL